MTTSQRLSLAGAIASLVFWDAFGLHRFYDDWVFASEAQRALNAGEVWRYIREPIGQHWSPLWQAFEVANVNVVGWESDRLIRLVTLGMVVAGLWWFLRTAARLGASTLAAACGAVVLGVHHLNAVPDYSFDVYAQVAVDLCSWIIASAALSLGFDPERSEGSWLPIGITAVYVAALLMKEQALAALAAVTVVAIWFQFVERAPAPARRALWTTWVNMLVASSAFAVLRHQAGVPVSGMGAFRLCVSCVPVNLATMAGALLVPMRTMPVFFAVVDPRAHPVVLVAAMAGAAGVALALWTGIRGLHAHARRSDARRARLFAGLAIASMFPTALLQHVGELYPHTALFWFALLVAFAADGWAVQLAHRGSVVRWVAGFAACAYLALLLVGLRANLADMRATGERASVLQARFHDAVRDVPAGSLVVTRGLEQVKGPFDYSLYHLTTPGMLLMNASASLDFVAPVGVTLLDEGDWPGAERTLAGRRVFVATFTGDTVMMRPMDAGGR